MKQCECGCGTEIPELDQKGRPRRYVRNHHPRPNTKLGQIFTCIGCKQSFEQTRTLKPSRGLCRKCYGKNYYNHRPKKDIAGYRKKLRKERRSQVFKKLGSVCKCCGLTDERFLTVDHVYGGGGKHRKRTSDIQILKEVLREPEKYQLLCYNCNMAKGVYGQCPHILP